MNELTIRNIFMYNIPVNGTYYSLYRISRRQGFMIYETIGYILLRRNKILKTYTSENFNSTKTWDDAINYEKTLIFKGLGT